MLDPQLRTYSGMAPGRRSSAVAKPRPVRRTRNSMHLRPRSPTLTVSIASEPTSMCTTLHAVGTLFPHPQNAARCYLKSDAALATPITGLHITLTLRSLCASFHPHAHIRQRRRAIHWTCRFVHAYCALSAVVCSAASSPSALPSPHSSSFSHPLLTCGHVWSVSGAQEAQLMLAGGVDTDCSLVGSSRFIGEVIGDAGGVTTATVAARTPPRSRSASTSLAKERPLAATC